MDGDKWNGSTFLCVLDVEGYHYYDCCCDDEVDDYDYAPSRNTQPLTVSILDIARPAKRKGKYIFKPVSLY